MLPTPPENFDSRSTAEDLLNKYLTGGKYDAVDFPKRIKRSDADEILKAALAAKTIKPPLLMRVTRVMAFYDLRDRAPQVKIWLNRAETEEFHFLRSLLVVEILGDFGDPKLQAEADAYYKYLCSHTLAPKFWQKLIDAFVHLSPAADPKWISDPITKRIKQLEPDIAKDDDAAVEFYQLQDDLADRLATILKAKKAREAIAANKDDHRRRTDLGQFYLGLQKFAYVDMQHWAVIQLQRDCNANAPADLAAEFSNGLDLIKVQAAKHVPLDDPAKADIKIFVTRCARSIDFYRGTLTKPQAEYFAAQDHPDQLDLLHWNPFDSKTKRPADYSTPVTAS